MTAHATLTTTQIREAKTRCVRASELTPGDRIADYHRMSAPVVAEVAVGVGLRGAPVGRFVRVATACGRSWTVGPGASFRVIVAG